MILLDQLIDLRTGMRRGKADTLGAPWHSWIVDRLNVDPMVPRQRIGDRLALDGIAEHHGNDVARPFDQR